MCVLFWLTLVYSELRRFFIINKETANFASDHVTINVDRRETDQLGKGTQVVISESSTIATCPVKLFRRYLSEVEKFPVKAGH